jgi:glutamyl-tRNA synthetase
MLAVVVDDHDMGVTHIIRGDDHLINAGRQLLIYLGMGWKPPVFAHIPLIHGDDGKKLSKRHGATGAEEFREMGYMPEAMRNYLARLGWSHGNDELFTTAQAIEWFDFKGMGKSPSRLDFKKLDNVSAHHIKTASEEEIMSAMTSFVAASDSVSVSDAQLMLISDNLSILRDRCKRLPEIIDKAQFLFATRPLEISDEASQVINSVSNGILKQLTITLSDVSWSQDNIEQAVKEFAAAHELKLGQIAQPIRAVLTGRTSSPSVFDMMVALGKSETLARLEDQT